VRYSPVSPEVRVGFEKSPVATSSCQSLARCVSPVFGSEKGVAWKIADVAVMEPIEVIEGVAGAVLGPAVLKSAVELQPLQRPVAVR
jgi:hypothetical protein